MSKPSDGLSATGAPDPLEDPSCCSAFYEQDWVRYLAEDSFHPGGAPLSKRLVESMSLATGAPIADLGCGTGTTALMLSRDYDLRVSGVDLSADNIDRARLRARETNSPVEFHCADAGALPFEDAELDAVLAECSFSLFSDRPGALAEIRRVLRPGGGLALSDMATHGELPEDIAAVIAPWTCLVDAMDEEAYTAMFTAAGFSIGSVSDESTGLSQMIVGLKRKLLLLGAGATLSGKTLPALDLGSIKHWLDRFETEVEQGRIRYLAFLLNRDPDSL
jgi:ubiquinone/menaquinone biosynthesis C-methylase UbiE